ncbi:adenosylmethionine--8-amino-7-oxononanoate transaminase [Trichlorobacter ammonificans]|uniref:Adenosylmethionine-8-amino-7-oxononanoate aminotransferase n=1 Tax=Trichlorobacter ammonificans TaxID=2916410 RepID=A0ABM9D7D0_9BACT|nr:adenosylmethionine--8-amino-7-oxononanoate transaminase [Trichlorobacter ammonificans]CAH2030635.1 Adenosylmethionine-8-amino-7-oxononanoate aminotransferase [Trichlorobacter ammonificans]
MTHTTAQLQTWDKQYVWHPFTQMQDWLADDPIVIVKGEGSWLIDSDGNRYLDGVASMWTNVHGHSHPELNRALAEQAAKIEHSTLLGLAGEQSILLAKRLVEITPPGLTRVFYSDNGSTAVEVGLKMAYQYHCHRGEPQRTRFLRLQHAYHGDTVGAMSVGGIPIYHATFSPLLFSTIEAPAPYCYRCPLGKDDPAACGMACLGELERLVQEHRGELAGMMLEPLLQGAGGMIVHPRGYLRGVRELCDRYGLLLITDEVATGFGRTGRMFACEHEEVSPDIMAISKGLCAGYLPLAATLATEKIYGAFLGNYAELKTFFHGHTFTGNPLACAVALKSLELFEENSLLAAVRQRSEQLALRLARLAQHPQVGNVRQCGLAAGVELVKGKHSKEPYPWEEKRGIRVCVAARKHGVFSRPLGNTVVVFPPLAISAAELDSLLTGLERAIGEVCGDG